MQSNLFYPSELPTSLPQAWEDAGWTQSSSSLCCLDKNTGLAVLAPSRSKEPLAEWLLSLRASLGCSCQERAVKESQRGFLSRNAMHGSSEA